MEGDNINTINSIDQQFPERKKDHKFPLFIGIIIGLILGMAISPFILNLLSENNAKIPIYQQFEESSWGEYTYYRNEDLKVETSVQHFSSGNSYNARWVNITGNDYGLHGWWNPSSLYDYILEYSEELSENQLKWFDYMLHNVIK